VLKNKKIKSNTEPKIAVRNLCVGFKKGEIFGLLGPNGAGKTTTMSVITADILPDAGLIKIFGENLNLANLKVFYENVGYCPQNNPLWEEITLKEHLILYASIKKVDPNKIISLCEEYIVYFYLLFLSKVFKKI
jgi:ABC-type multidrug transport system ATPase subunit